jgi:hypothetical protein
VALRPRLATGVPCSWGLDQRAGRPAAMMTRRRPPTQWRNRPVSRRCRWVYGSETKALDRTGGRGATEWLGASTLGSTDACPATGSRGSRSMKVVLFCGGRGLRLREYSEVVPKPMIPIGVRPILWHVMRYYAHFGHREFILCLGYRAEAIKDYFLARQRAVDPRHHPGLRPDRHDRHLPDSLGGKSRRPGFSRFRCSWSGCMLLHRQLRPSSLGDASRQTSRRIQSPWLDELNCLKNHLLADYLRPNLFSIGWASAHFVLHRFPNSPGRFQTLSDRPGGWY